LFSFLEKKSEPGVSGTGKLVPSKSGGEKRKCGRGVSKVQRTGAKSHFGKWGEKGVKPR